MLGFSLTHHPALSLPPCHATLPLLPSLFHAALWALLNFAATQMRIASCSLMEKLGDLRVRAAVQQSRAIRLHNPMLELRMQQLARKVMDMEDVLAAKEHQQQLLREQQQQGQDQDQMLQGQDNGERDQQEQGQPGDGEGRPAEGPAEQGSEEVPGAAGGPAGEMGQGEAFAGQVADGVMMDCTAGDAAAVMV